MNICVVGVAALLLGVAAFADDAQRARLMGTWESQGGSDQDSKITWLLEAKGDALHVTELQGIQKLAEFECAVDGRECATKESGHAAKVSLWYNGSKLVELETKGSAVVKRRFSVAGTDEEMDVEIIPIVSDSKGETEHFRRVKVPLSK